VHDPAFPKRSLLVDRLVGSPSQFPLEHRLLTACCLVGLLGCVIVCPLNFYLHLDSTQSLIVLGFGLLQVGFYYALRVRRRFRAVLLPELLLATALFVYLWFACGGSRGGAQYFFFVGVVVPLLLARGWMRAILTVAFLVLVAALFAVEYRHPEWVPDPYRSRAVRYLDVSASFMFAVSLLSAVVLVLKRNYSDALEMLERERAKSDWLLHNVLPRSVSDRLKLSPGVIADRFDHATVLFADIVGFTGRSSAMAAQDVVAMLNEIFSRFDALVEKHQMEKIKTIGDAYMAVAGVPMPRADHAHAAAAMALDMLDVVRTSPELPRDLEVRIGLHSGPLVAGVIGTKKFIYDLWGDTVNTASRMESHGEPGTVQVTEETYRLLEGHFALKKRGRIAVKGKGELDTWLLFARGDAR